MNKREIDLTISCLEEQLAAPIPEGADPEQVTRTAEFLEEMRKAAALPAHKRAAYFAGLFTVGQKIKYAGFECTIVSQSNSCPTAWNIRAPGGLTFASGLHLIRV